VKHKGQQVKYGKDLSGMVFAMAEVVFKVVAAIFQYVVVFVLYFPPGPAAFG
jgi:Na+/melibiose symporter-like transporter